MVRFEGVSKAEAPPPPASAERWRRRVAMLLAPVTIVLVSPVHAGTCRRDIEAVRAQATFRTRLPEARRSGATPS